LNEQGAPVPRSEQKARRAASKLLPKALRDAARGTGWKVAREFLFRTHGDWFVSVRTASAIIRYDTAAHLQAKPLALDPLFWDIVLLPDNRRLPLSFRATGAWTCSTPDLAARVVVEEGEDFHAAAEAIVAWADSSLPLVAGIEDRAFIDSVSGALPWGVRPYLATLICALIFAGRQEEAMQVCEEAKARGEEGGFTIRRSTTFVDLALDWLRKRNAVP
jgi:hypothetical protein